MAEMKDELSQMQPTSPGSQVGKVFMDSLSPMEYACEGDFDDYLSQFEPMAGTLYWGQEKKGSALHGKLKGKALTCVSSCLDRRFSTLVDKLRDRFSPKEEEMFLPTADNLQEEA